MPNLDKEMSNLLGTFGAPARVQLRTRYFDDVIKMTKRGYSPEEIDRALISKVIKESPEEASHLLAGGMSRQEAEQHLIDAGVDLEDVDEDEIERLRQLGSLLTKPQYQSSNKRRPTKPLISLRRKRLIQAVVSAWAIWAAIVFSLNTMELLELYYIEEYLSWLLLPPVIVLSVYVWANKYVFKEQ